MGLVGGEQGMQQNQDFTQSNTAFALTARDLA